ncbi:GH39 family glycosyl hydrolase [Actinomadura kijaniata]|uniref:GH39 family glycosyl hydrolase n=1 Tax=Actinomadura kijaniata TaxID=46161 RepID=UPI003F1B7F4E
MEHERSTDDTGEIPLPPRPGTGGTRPPRGPRRWRPDLLAALVAALLVAAPAAVLVAGRSGGDAAPGRAAERTGDRAGARGPVVGGGGATAAWPSWGLTHTQHTLPLSAAASRQRAATARQPVAQVQSLMGWGATNPEPSPGRHDFTTLDRRVDLIRATRGTPVITLCCAPDWMKGGTAGRTDWTRLEKAPDPAHYDDFANLAATVARRYPDVRHYLVWNEFKGFWDPARNTWDAAAYTALYNKVYTALKKVDPRIRVGGPYIPMDSNPPGQGPPSEVSGPWGAVDPRVLEATRYWLRNKAGADFLAVDGASLPGRTGRPGQAPARVNEIDALAKFPAVTRWLREQSGDRLPVWWAEWYVQPRGVTWSDERLGAVQTAAMMEFARGGASAAFYWSPQVATSAECLGCLWSGTAAGNRGTPTLTMLQNFTRWFPPGTPLLAMASSNPDIRVLAQPRQMVAVNTTGRPARTLLNGKALELGPYESRWIPL